LGVVQRAGRSLERSIVEFLRSSRLLLVLDNCEHLLEASGRLAAGILVHCPQVRVLATSREALAVSGEQVWALSSLDLPEPGGGLEAVAGSASVRPFGERAAGARHDFAVSEANVAAVVEVLRHLDGIPLAIELAAARVSAMTPAEIAGLLDERFRLLTRGRRTAVERHQTLRATVDWSYGLLSARERTVFDRLAVLRNQPGLDPDHGRAEVRGDVADRHVHIRGGIAGNELAQGQGQHQLLGRQVVNGDLLHELGVLRSGSRSASCGATPES
jgi:predicted ATPase